MQRPKPKCNFPGCNFRHKWPSGIKEHEKIHSDDPKVRKPYDCQYCDYRSSCKYYLKDHILLHTDGPKFVCSIADCHYRTHNKHYLQSHVKRHNAPELYCAFKGCNYKSKYKSVLKVHYETHQVGGRKRNTECPLCSKMFYTPAHLQTHLTTHTNEKPFKCSFCSYQSKTRHNLSCHLQDVHAQFLTGEEQGRHKCELCNFSTGMSRKLRRHLASHIDERPYACTFPGCSYRAKRSDSLKSHTTHIHAPEIHRCPEPDCIYVGKNKLLLRVHLKSHNKRFPCVVPGCNRQFHSEVSLLKHQSMHDPTRKYECNRCPLRFIVERELRLHAESVHGEGRRFHCPRCSKSYSRRNNLRAHIRRVHQEEESTLLRFYHLDVRAEM